METISTQPGSNSVEPVITADMLRAKRACPEQVDMFMRTFPNGTKVTVDNARKYGALFNVDWAAWAFLRPPALREYKEAIVPIERAYIEATATAWRAYEEAIATARRAYDKAIATARRASKKAIATARRTCDEATATTRRTCRAACAVAFAQAYIEQENEK